MSRLLFTPDGGYVGSHCLERLLSFASSPPTGTLTSQLFRSDRRAACYIGGAVPSGTHKLHHPAYVTLYLFFWASLISSFSSGFISHSKTRFEGSGVTVPVYHGERQNILGWPAFPKLRSTIKFPFSYLPYPLCTSPVISCYITSHLFHTASGNNVVA